ncbi:MAG: group 1 glycosyl transferase [uncultured bacterium]|nr:MAG: group 1 glycosyl transferase [uncultured bacterium]HBR71459.1 hypothetical protein [Candidatus Moranbacteria bacterium]
MAKIGIDGSRAFIGKRTGIEEYSYQIIKHLRDFFVDDEIILYIRNSQEVDFELPKNWKIRKMRFPRFWTQIRLSWEMLFHSPDILFIPAHTVPFIHPKKTVVVIHGLEYEMYPQAYSLLERIYMRFVIKNSCRWADKIICVSENTKMDVEKLYGVDEKKIKVIYEGYNIFQDFDFSQKTSFDLDKIKPYILFIGRIEERKNVKGIVEAFDFIKEKYGIPHKLLLVGKKGYGYEEAQKRIDISKYKEDIVEVGYVSEEEKYVFLKNAEVFVFPSFYEGFGLPILEAQNAFVPVVTSNVSSIPEVADDAVFYANPNNFEEIAENIYILISNREAKENIVKRGIENVKRFSWAQCAKEISELLKI